MRVVAALFVLVGALACAPTGARGHGLEPALLSLRERSPGRFDVVWKSSKIRLPGAQVRPTLPDRCRPTADAPQAGDDGDRIRLQWTVDCGAAGLAGQTIGVADLDVATIDALLRVEQIDGTRVETILTAHHPTWTAPADPTRDQLVRHFVRLGAACSFASLDRLLLLFGFLLLLAGTPQRLVQAALAFALGQAIALAATGVGVIAVPAAGIDILIAGAVLWIAVSLTRPEARPGPPRSAWLTGLLCGALAGAACAAAFGHAGSASLDAPLALLAFTAGVGISQAAALLVALSLGAVAARRHPPRAAILRQATAYAMGVLAVFWCLERLTA